MKSTSPGVTATVKSFSNEELARFREHHINGILMQRMLLTIAERDAVICQKDAQIARLRRTPAARQ